MREAHGSVSKAGRILHLSIRHRARLGLELQLNVAGRQTNGERALEVRFETFNTFNHTHFMETGQGRKHQ
jgi:hypothetical protein